MEFQKEPGRIFAMEGDKLLAEVTFPVESGVAVIDHTFVDGSLRGQGVASQLLEAATAQIRAAGRKARPVCSYAQRWFAEHPESADLL
jgi:Predicted acetyltransferase